MAEVVDWLLLFWFVLALVVYVLGNIFQDQPAKGGNKNKRNSLQTTAFDDWSPNQHLQQQHRTSYSNNQFYANDQQFRSNINNNANFFDQRQQQYNEPVAGSYYAPKSYESPATSSAQTYRGQQSMAGSSSYPTTVTEQQVRLDQHGNLLVSSNGGQASPGAAYDSHPLDQRQATLVDSASIPTASGYNADCVEWVNSILFLFYTQAEKYGPIICENIYRSLNEKLSNITNSSAEYSNLMIEFSGINCDASTRPELTNVRTESESDRSVSANCKIYVKRVSLNLSIRRLAGTSQSSSFASNTALQQDFVQYEVVLENLEGKLKSMAMLNDKLIVIQFLEKPDTKIWLKPRQQQFSNQSAAALISEDNLVQIILQTLTQVVVDLYFGDDIDFPQCKLELQHHQHQSTYSNYKNKINTIFKGSASELKRQLKHDFFGSLTAPSETKERRLFVKIVRATNINYNQNATCLMELDVPNQQAISSTKTGSSNPNWDEHFLFNVSDKSSELKLELWDSIDSSSINQLVDLQKMKDPATPNQQPAANQSKDCKFNKAELTAAAKFLGFSSVKMDELRKSPVQRLNLALQPIGQPSDLNNAVGGELQVELLFLEHSSSPTPNASGQAGEHHHGRSSGARSLRKSTSANSLAYQQGDVVSIDRKLTPSGYVITTTTITKQKQQRPTSLSAANPNQQQLRSHSPISSATGVTEQSLDFDGLMDSGGLASASNNPLQATDNFSSTLDRRSEAPSDAIGGGGRLSRSRSRSRSFLRAIKKRFSFSRTRSRSVGGSSGIDHHNDEASNYRSEAPSPTLGGHLDTLSMESRSRASSEVSALGAGNMGSAAPNRATSVPTTRDPNEVPTIVINKSRLSDTGSAFTFTHPKSQLVIEVMEPILSDGTGSGSGSKSKSKGRPRYYAIPENSANKRKWSRRGLKLHLFNEHQFIACHLAGSSTCHMCGRVFSRRPGKQGYKCRNCHFLSHKECHVKVDHNCPYASRDGLKLEFIDSDPPANLIDELQHRQTTSSTTTSSANLARQDQSSLVNDENYHKPSYSRQTLGGDKPRRMQVKSISMEVDDR